MTSFPVTMPSAWVLQPCLTKAWLARTWASPCWGQQSWDPHTAVHSALLCGTWKSTIFPVSRFTLWVLKPSHQSCGFAKGVCVVPSHFKGREEAAQRAPQVFRLPKLCTQWIIASAIQHYWMAVLCFGCTSRLPWVLSKHIYTRVPRNCFNCARWEWSSVFSLGFPDSWNWGGEPLNFLDIECLIWSFSNTSQTAWSHTTPEHPFKTQALSREQSE